MRLIGAMVCACILAGCASRMTAGAAAGAVADAERLHQGDAVAAALVFDPPIAAEQPELDLARSAREPAAFVSYDQVFTTFFYLRVDDRQRLSRDGTSQRRVISETFGISRR